VQIPIEIPAPKDVDIIISKGGFTYCKTKKSCQLFSWGSGFNFVLGNNDDESEYKPYPIKKEFLKGENLADISLGTQHVMILLNKEGVARDFDE